MLRNLVICLILAVTPSLTGCRNLFPTYDDEPTGPRDVNDFLKQPSTFRATGDDNWGTGVDSQARDVERNLGYSHR